MNHKATAFTTKMDADARLRQLEEQVRERDDTIVRLEGQLAELRSRLGVPAPDELEVSV